MKAGGRRPRSTLKTAVVASALLALTAALLVAFVLRLSSSPDAKVHLGDTTFEVGQVRRLAPLIDRDGPLLFADALKRHGRNLFVQHVGDDATTGWLAFEAQSPGADPTCHVIWHQDRGVFEDECSHAMYGPEGPGLTHYPTEIKRQKKAGLVLFVDLRSPIPD